MADSNDTRHMDDGQGSLSVPDGTLQPGQVLQSRYRVLGLIGMGGMGAVYQARDLNFANVTRLCAVKEMINLAQDAQLREQTIRNFEREAEILATLSHPSIPQIYDFFSFGDRAYLVMEFIQGRDLENLLNGTDKFLPHEQITTWAIELCDVLEYLHNHEPAVVFRDMKPANIMIDHHKRVRLIDFGIAKTFQMGQPGTMIGTEGYSPPELYRGIATPEGDIYALGATLHHLLSRRDPRLEPPFSFDQRKIREINPSVPDELEKIVMKALSYDPKERYPSADAMKQIIEAMVEGSSTAVVVAPQPAAAPAPAPVVPQPMPVDSGPVAARTVAVLPDSVSPIWHFRVEDAIRCTPLVYRDTVYIGAYDNNLWALDAKSGEFRWNMATEGGIGGSPVYNGGVIYVGSSDRRLYAVDVRTGKRKWSYLTEGKIFSTPLLAHGSIFFGADDGTFYSIKPGVTNAKEVWTFKLNLPIRSTARIHENYLYFGSDAGDFVCIDISGEFTWRFQSRRRIMSSPVIHEGLVYIGSDDWHLYGLDLDQGFPIWRFRTKGAIVSSPIVANGKVLFGSADGFIYAVDALSGKEKWSYEVGEAVTSSPAVEGDAMYIGAGDGVLYALHVESGDLLWRFQSDGPILSSPTVAEGIVYIGSDDRTLYALQA